MLNTPPSLDDLSIAVDKLVKQIATDDLPPVCIAISDAQGELVLLQRFPGTPGRTVGIATAKAYTAARMGISTAAFKQRLINEQQTLRDFMDPGYTALPGGLPIRSADQLVGAVGISGRTPEQDHQLAESFIALLTKR